FRDLNQPLHWRQQQKISGRNILAMGILHEATVRWTPHPTQVFAQTNIFQPQRLASPVTNATAVDVPDSVQIVTQLENGGRGLYHLSGIALFGPGMQIHLFGSQGTIKYVFGETERLLIGSAGDKELREAEIPAEKKGGWRVEAEFIGSIRGEETVRFTNFPSGVRYMEFTEAVTRSADTNQPVTLPL
ncbi:MAG: gfo/Idh/MocA family oxidoreductase, partial [Planctomycetes bacterium]|nr:gfo/Idh/MocA family oxidoreductase [Planctomycetota bacterium]